MTPYMRLGNTSFQSSMISNTLRSVSRVGQWWCVFLIPDLWRQRQVDLDLGNFEAQLVYVVSSRTARTMQRDPDSKKKTLSSFILIFVVILNDKMDGDMHVQTHIHKHLYTYTFAYDYVCIYLVCLSYLDLPRRERN